MVPVRFQIESLRRVEGGLSHGVHICYLGDEFRGIVSAVQIDFVYLYLPASSGCIQDKVPSLH